MSSDAQRALTDAIAYELFSQCLIEISEQVAQGNKVTLNGFGKFEPYKTQGSSGRRVPWDNNRIANHESKFVPKFYAAPNFKEKVIDSLAANEKKMKGI